MSFGNMFGTGGGFGMPTMPSLFQPLRSFQPANSDYTGKASLQRPMTTSASVWPTNSRRITGKYGEQRQTHKHAGLDIAAPEGETIRATRDGVVKFAGQQGGYGNTVIIAHDDGTETLYGHASQLIAKQGARLSAGTPIALVGSTGRSTGPHLHFEARKGGKAIDPNAILNAVGGAVQDTAQEAVNTVKPLFKGFQSMAGGSMFNPFGNPSPSSLPTMPTMPSMFGVNSLASGTPFGSTFNTFKDMVKPLEGFGKSISQAGRAISGGGKALASNAGGIAGKIAEVARKYGVPENLALAVARVESNLRPNAKSGAGAIGVFQLMPGTAQGLGVDPYNVDQNIDGGVRYLKQLRQQFGDNYTLVLAGYNAGPGNAKSGKWKQFPETRNYVNKVMAQM